MAQYSRQGFNIAFVGLHRTAQTACAEHLKKEYNFKRLVMDEPLRKFIKTCYDIKNKEKIKFSDRLAFYDSIYKVDPDLFIKYVKSVMKISYSDTVISDVRYVNEMEALKEMGFIIVRVTTPSGGNPYHLIRTAAKGSTALALLYDKKYAINSKASYSLNWPGRNHTRTVMDTFLEGIGYNTGKIIEN